MRLELTRPNGHYPLKVARLPIPPSGHVAGRTAWSEKRDSNPRPRPWQGRALPTELFSHFNVLAGRFVPVCGCKVTTFSRTDQIFCNKKITQKFTFFIISRKSAAHNRKKNRPTYDKSSPPGRRQEGKPASNPAKRDSSAVRKESRLPSLRKGRSTDG